MELLAKSDGTLLIDHSKLVELFALEIYDQMVSEEYKKRNRNKIRDNISDSSLLHDIGKCIESFQNELKSKQKNKKNNDDKFIIHNYKKKNKKNNDDKYILHNQIGWKFLLDYIKKPIILKTIYWHHGVYTKIKNSNDIKISDIDNSNMRIFYNKLNLSYKFKESGIQAEPKFFDNNDNHFERQRNIDNEYLVRICVVSGDRIASKYNKDEVIDLLKNKNKISNIISDYLSKNKIIPTKNPYSNDRYILQENIVSDINKSKKNTFIIKAPAGFGKTLVGVLFSISRNKKTIWVCPRNIVAESVYSSILEELTAFDINNVNVQLYLTGEVKDSNCENISAFDADIIVTNIDNYLAPNVNNTHMDKLFLINSADVIFDEYHELDSELALYSCFISIMRNRNNRCECKTILLSATPKPMEFLWDIENKTEILPSIDKHYNAAHDKLYHITNDFNINNDSSHLYIYNAIKSAQNHKKEYDNNSLLFHSKFEEHRKKEIKKEIYTLYSKKNKRLNNNKNLIGTHIIQASLDLSFKDLTESVMSPESTLQRMGRCNRFGDYNDISNINIFKSDTRSEIDTINLLYDATLSNLWYNYIIENLVGKELSLNDIYDYYNIFNIKYKNEIKKHINDKNTKSLDELIKIYPVKRFNTYTNDIISAGGNKLRSNGNEIFYICEKTDGTYTDIFSHKDRNGLDKDFKESDNVLSNMKKIMKKISGQKYDYPDLNKRDKYDRNGITLDMIRLYAKRSNSPYIRFDKKYSEEYGIIDKDFLK